MSKVKGKRSPRWALNERMVIPCEDGSDYLIRRRLIQTPLFGVYVHQLLGPDKEDPHDHPWSFVSVVLRGGYTEDFYPFPHLAAARVVPFFRRQEWRRGSAHRMGTATAHRITHVLPGTVSLIFVGRRKREWGFFPAGGGWVPWKEYEGVS
jgi:hypothetical protein